MNSIRAEFVEVRLQAYRALGYGHPARKADQQPLPIRDVRCVNIHIHGRGIRDALAVLLLHFAQGAVGSTGPSTDSPPSGEPGASAAPSPGEPASGPGALSGPAATPSGESPAATGQQQAGSGYEPQWDAARNTYILWEPNRRQWLGWDDSAKEWRPL